MGASMTAQRVACPGGVLISARICLVCHWPVLPARGVAQAHLRAMSHQGTCSSTVRALERIYDRSSRGRWRPWRQVVALASGVRCYACTEVPA